MKLTRVLFIVGLSLSRRYLMVNKISKKSKSKYQQAGSNKFYYVGIVLALVGLVLVIALNMGGSSSVQAVAGPAPSGANCPENVAYLQVGVNKYKELVGSFPADLKELVEIKDGKGPFVEKLVECPSGNLYVIENGIVKEKAR